MAAIETVRGTIDSSDLGRVLMHEHVFVLSPEVMDNYDTGWDEETRVADAIARLTALKENGISTIVDLTVLGLGRFMPRIQRVAAAVDINIVVATGLYTYNEIPHYFHFRGPGLMFEGPEVMIDMFVNDIEVGIAGTGVKAAILKCATDEPGMTHGVERVLRAVAKAHRLTGVPITTHTHAGTRRGLEQQDIFDSEGVDLSQVVIGHCGDSTDVDYLVEVLKRGSFIGMDRFGIDTILPFEDRIQSVVSLVEKGFSNQIVLSHDAACFNDWLPAEQLPIITPQWHYQHILRDVVPALLQRGVSQEQIDQMLIHNPRRIFERAKVAY
ncbi:MAG: phosphotriesterase-related protein [Actinomycetota bacterium]